jgi:hypothetical protein
MPSNVNFSDSVNWMGIISVPAFCRISYQQFGKLLKRRRTEPALQHISVAERGSMEIERTPSESKQQPPTSQQEGKRDYSTLTRSILRIPLWICFAYLWWSVEAPSIWFRLFGIFFVAYESFMLFMFFPRRKCTCPFCAASVICGSTVCYRCLKDIRSSPPNTEIAKDQR